MKSAPKTYEKITPRFFQSRNIHDYKPILEGLIEDFGYIYYHAILEWCGIISSDTVDAERYWQLYLIEVEDRVAGICGLYAQRPHTTDELWLGWFGLLPEFRNKGLGSAALAFMEDSARKAGCGALYSYVNKEAKPMPFYQRHGFARISTVREYLAQNPDLTMRSFEHEDDHVIAKKI